jgi:uncharacterized repeat protein (TIGR01451 family)
LRATRIPDPGGDGLWSLEDNYGDLRPHLTSAARDTGTNDGLPPDLADLDGDGNTSETLPQDRLADVRVFNGTVDKGAYETQVRLSITKSVDQSNPLAGGSVIYSVVVANSGLLAANGAVISDPLAEGLQFAGPLVLEPAGSGAAGTAPPDLVTGLTIEGGERVTVTLPVTVTGRWAIRNVAQVSSAEVPVPITAAATITGANWIPVAEDDAYSTTFNTPLTVDAPGFLGNDRDGEGDPLTAVYHTGVSDGVVKMEADGSFVYTPNLGFEGTTSFSYRADDGYDLSPPATVEIMVGARRYGVYLPLVLR